MKRNWLIDMRNKKGLKQKELADRCGIRNSFMSMIENGQRDPSGVVALKIAEVLGFDMSLFYAENVHETKNKTA